jgi:hypothetical protein
MKKGTGIIDYMSATACYELNTLKKCLVLRTIADIACVLFMRCDEQNIGTATVTIGL